MQLSRQKRKASHGRSSERTSKVLAAALSGPPIAQAPRNLILRTASLTSGGAMGPVRIGFFDCKGYDREHFERMNQEFGFSIRYISSRLNSETALLCADFDAICVFVNDDLSESVIEHAHEAGVKLIALRCAGYNNVDFSAAHGIVHVVRVPAYSPFAVAEHVVALLLTLNRKTHKAYFRTREANFSIGGLMGFDLHGKTAGIIGTGKIGLTLITILRGFGMRVLAFDKFPNAEVAKEFGFDYTSLDRLFKESDIISLHCPLTHETRHIINSDTIQSMKDGVFILNTGRGKLIDTKALIDGLKSRKIGAAGLDVYEEESDYFFEDLSDQVIEDDVLARLMTFNNVLITSHQGFFTREAMENIARTTLRNIQAYFKQQPLENEVCYLCAAGGEGECSRETTGRCF